MSKARFRSSGRRLRVIQDRRTIDTDAGLYGDILFRCHSPSRVAGWTLLTTERAILVFVATDDADRAHTAIFAALNALDAGEE